MIFLSDIKLSKTTNKKCQIKSNNIKFIYFCKIVNFDEEKYFEKNIGQKYILCFVVNRVYSLTRAGQTSQASQASFRIQGVASTAKGLSPAFSGNLDVVFVSLQVNIKKKTDLGKFTHTFIGYTD